ncbi:hypothetical protein llap_21545 [Limosa lapponica baueri]|uniref:Uncharacterized protein n=1 Tax=Limosa lapponica baueri TaxID=1758121 RepID=A0A2I0T2X2_LIMLA|nr:hypothetical protein llap_21545 [Limosa lapponica baueri]
MAHGESPAAALAAERPPAPAPSHQAAPLTFYRYRRRKRQLIVLKTSEQILGRRHSQLVNIANYLQLRERMYPDDSDMDPRDQRTLRCLSVTNTRLTLAALTAGGGSRVLAHKTWEI